MFQGAFTAMVTPFRDGRVDYDRLAKNVTDQIADGIDGLVPCGTTGESPTLSHDEHRAVVEHVVKAAVSEGARKVKVIAGTGSNATSEAMELTKHAKSVGADAALMVNPYYNKPTQEGLYRHFMAVADAVELPILLYNIPGRTGITMSPQTVQRLAQHPNIVGIKEATGSLDIASEIAAITPEDFTILSGDDSLTLPIMSVGGKGVISVLSNLLPDRVRALVHAALKEDFIAARELHLAMFPLFKAMFLETNPIPIKTAMALAGRDTGEFRLPLCEMASANRETLAELLKQHGLL